MMSAVCLPVFHHMIPFLLSLSLSLFTQSLTKGFNIALREQTSVINKKIDIFLPGNGGFSRSTFFQKMKGIVEKKLNNHVISIDRIRSNGDSRVLRPLTLPRAISFSIHLSLSLHRLLPTY